MKKSFFIITALALVLASCGGSQTRDKNEGTSDAVAETEYTGEGALPELVFDNLEFYEIEYIEHAEVPDVIKNAKRIVIKGDEIRISDGEKETVCKIDLETSSEEANPDGYYWMYSIKDNQPVDGDFYIVAEYEEACIVRNEDPKTRPIHIFFEGRGWLYPKNFNSWDNLKRKITKEYPSDEEYMSALEYINREEPDLSDLEDYDDSGDNDDDEGVAMQVWDNLMKHYDPFGTLDGDEMPSEDMIAENRKYVKNEHPWMAVFDPGSETEGFSETVACYRHEDGYWIVLDYWHSADSPDYTLTVFNYQNGKLTRIDDYFPADFLSNGKYLGLFYKDEISVVRDTDEYEEVHWYKWNGKKFVKE